MTWQTEIAKKRIRIQSCIPKKWKEIIDNVSVTDAHSFDSALSQLLSKREIEITTKSASFLVKEIAARKLTSEAVTTAFCKRTALVAKLTNAVTEPLYFDAIDRAKQLDARHDTVLEKYGQLPPLYGLPITVKDSFNVPGVQSTLGVVSRIARPVAEEPSPVIDLLVHKLGAIVFAKTNVPQAIITPEAHNNVFGRTLNFSNPSEWGSGGSSGGEGVLVSSNASPLGLGTDLAGSIRLPAWNNGCVGFKPSLKLVPYLGFEDAGKPPREPGLTATVGPLARNVEDIDLFMKSIIDAKPWETIQGLEQLTWGNVSNSKNLTIGVVTDAGAPVHKEVLDAIEQVTKTLEQKGNKIVPLDNASVPNVKDILTNIGGPLCGLDTDCTHLKAIASGGEPLVPSVIAGHKGLYEPYHETETNEISIRAAGEKTESCKFEFIKQVIPFTVPDERIKELKQLQQKVKDAWDKVFQDNHLDILICPLGYKYAPEYDGFGDLPFGITWNTVDYPALILPLNRQELEFNNKVKPRCIQLVAPNVQDEKLVKFSQQIAEELELS